MSGLAKSYNQALRRDLTAYAAWFPVTNTFEIGDYGLIEDGVFKSIGKISSKFPDIELKTASGPESKIDFKSEGTKMIKLGADGEVDSLASLGNADAKLKFMFSKENSCVVKATLSSMQLTNIEEVAIQLANKSSWKRKYKVVSSIYNGDQCVVICAREANTEVTLSGAASVLQQVEGGKVSASLDIEASKESVFNSIGESGVIGLDLFKINLFGNVKLLAQVTADDISIEQDLGDLEDDF